VNFQIKFLLFQNFLEIEDSPAAGGTFCYMKLQQLLHLGAQSVRPYFVAEEIQQRLRAPRRFVEPHRFLRAPIKAVSVPTSDQPILRLTIEIIRQFEYTAKPRNLMPG
jgi:hypothetical protein